MGRAPLRNAPEPAPHAQPQISAKLAAFDDPYGIVWRINNALRRFSVTRLIRFLQGLVTAPTYGRPILIVGMPRSGTTMLFHVLRACETLGSRPSEGHNIWRRFHHPRKSEWTSDHVA